MAGTTNRSTTNTEVVIGNAHLAQDSIQALITGGKSIVSVTQVKASVWLIIFS